MRVILSFLASLALTLPLFAGQASAASVNDFSDYTLRNSNNSTLLFGRLHVPTSYASEPDKPRPLILFLHGAGESGTNNISQINGNIDNLLAAAKARDAFLYAPQTNSGWTSNTVLTRTIQMIDRAIAERSVDPARIYLTGLSMGGGGAWNFLSAFSDRFAATVPICAVTPTSNFQPGLVVDEPIWAFHARNDGTVSPTASRAVVNTLLNEAGQPFPSYPALNNFAADFNFQDPLLDLQYTEYRTGNHGIWPQVYNTPALYDWMFAHGVVPEPSALTLALVGLVACRCRRRIN
jgi:predicted peptidase